MLLETHLPFLELNCTRPNETIRTVFVDYAINGLLSHVLVGIRHIYHWIYFSYINTPLPGVIAGAGMVRGGRALHEY